MECSPIDNSRKYDLLQPSAMVDPFIKSKMGKNKTGAETKSVVTPSQIAILQENGL